MNTVQRRWLFVSIGDCGDTSPWETSGREQTPCGKEIEGKYAWNSLEFLGCGPLSAAQLVLLQLRVDTC